MGKTLVIVESPSKAKKLGEYLGDDYVIKASGGHVRDLPVKSGDLGYDKVSLRPIYELTERGATNVKYLKSALRGCDRVLLATDPDREGEAIAWHLAEVLGIKRRERIKFHEITPSAISAAVSKPNALNMALVYAQEARRVIDRQVGWLVSKPLSSKIGEAASAGRVQSPALGLVVDRERSIKAFVREQYFTTEARFDGWVAVWPAGDIVCKSREVADETARIRTFLVKSFEENQEHEAPPPAFRTSKLLQAASVTLGFDPKKTMELAQRLYQVHGLITYHRTDETNLAVDAYQMIVNFCTRRGFETDSERRVWKAATGAQEAHEAIRPSDFEIEDHDALTDDERALYKLIHCRAVASQMKATVYAVREAVLTGENTETDFYAQGRVMTEPGWRGYSSIQETEADEEQGALNVNIPLLTVGQVFRTDDVAVVAHWTRAPRRYTKASLVTMLETLGIGRPATYAPLVEGLTERGYVRLDGRFLVPETVGEKICDALTDMFSFMDVNFTSHMEDGLDGIVRGEGSFDTVVRNFYDVLTRELGAFGGHVDSPAPRAILEDMKCPSCAKPMIKRSGARGAFYGCSTYPKCKGTKAIS